MKELMRSLSVNGGVILASTFLAPQLMAEENQRSPSARSALEEIVVVARRTEENLLDVPITVTAVSGERLKAASITDGVDLIRVVPTLNVQQSSTGPEQSYSLRGIRSGVVTYFNDVPANAVAVDDQIWDLASVQALSGPQGTFFGRNSTGGAILFVPERPTDELSGFIEGGVGNYASKEGSAVVNLPLSESFKVRLGARTIKRDGVVDNVLGSDLQSRDREAYRFSSIYEPTDNISNYTVVDYSERNESPLAFISSPVLATAGCLPGLGCIYGNQPAELGEQQKRFGIRKVGSSFVGIQQNREFGVSNILSVGIGESVTAKYIFGLRNSSYNQVKNQTSLDVPIQLGRNTLDDGKTTSHEIQLVGSLFNDRLSWNTGVFYSDSESESSRAYAIYRDPDLPFSDEGSIVAEQEDERETKAIYAQLTYNLTDSLSITGGVRYTEEEAKLKLYSVGPQFTFFGPEICRLPDTPDVDLGNCIRNLKDDYDAVTYNVSLDYRMSDNVLVYLTTRRGFNAGGFNSGVPVSQQPGDPQPTYDPEYIRDYEIGVKADWAIGDMEVRTNLSGFLAKYEDIQRSKNGISNEGVPYIGIATGPEATVKGLQFESAFVPLTGLQLNFNYGYLDTQYDKGSPGFLKGNKFAQAPRHTVNLSATYNRPVEIGGYIFITAGYTYQSEVTFQDDNIGSELAFQKGYELFDARVGWLGVAGSRFDLSLYGKNLADESYALERQDQMAAFGFLGTIYNDPRTYGVEMRYNFGQ